MLNIPPLRRKFLTSLGGMTPPSFTLEHQLEFPTTKEILCSPQQHFLLLACAQTCLGPFLHCQKMFCNRIVIDPRVSSPETLGTLISQGRRIQTLSQMGLKPRTNLQILRNKEYFQSVSHKRTQKQKYLAEAILFF